MEKNPLKRYLPISENLNEIEKLPTVMKGKERYVLDKFGKNLADLSESELHSINKQFAKDLDNLLKNRAKDEVDLLNKTKERELQIGKEINKVNPDPSILIPKVLDPWQQEVFGVINPDFKEEVVYKLLGLVVFFVI